MLGILPSEHLSTLFRQFHDLRHTAGTLALRQGVPLHTVSKMLGHSDPAMTLRRYAHVLEDMHEDAARAMDELF
jgi:integrase